MMLCALLAQGKELMAFVTVAALQQVLELPSLAQQRALRVNTSSATALGPIARAAKYAQAIQPPTLATTVPTAQEAILERRLHALRAPQAPIFPVALDSLVVLACHARALMKLAFTAWDVLERRMEPAHNVPRHRPDLTSLAARGVILALYSNALVGAAAVHTTLGAAGRILENVRTALLALPDSTASTAQKAILEVA